MAALTDCCNPRKPTRNTPHGGSHWQPSEIRSLATENTCTYHAYAGYAMKFNSCIICTNLCTCMLSAKKLSTNSGQLQLLLAGTTAQSLSSSYSSSLPCHLSLLPLSPRLRLGDLDLSLINSLSPDGDLTRPCRTSGLQDCDLPRRSLLLPLLPLAACDLPGSSSLFWCFAGCCSGLLLRPLLALLSPDAGDLAGELAGDLDRDFTPLTACLDDLPPAPGDAAAAGDLERLPLRCPFLFLCSLLLSSWPPPAVAAT